MPTIQKELTVPANATTSMFSGSAFEYPERDAAVSLGVTAAATGIVTTVQAGGETVLEESPAVIRTAMPVIPDDFSLNFAIAQGRRLILNARNTTGAGIVTRAIAQIAYLR
jgi:hypothetical protein